MLNDFFNKIFGPFRELRSTIFRVKQLPESVKGELKRAGSEAKSFGSEAKGAVSKGKEVQDKAKAGAQGAQKAGAQAQAAGQKVQAAPTKKGKTGLMGLFSKSKKCPGCGQKLHPTWEECPYCGYGKAAAGGAPPAAAGGGASSPQRTMALDISAGAIPGSQTGIVAWFIPLEGSKTGELFEIKGRVSVGSKDTNAICVPEPSISGTHCEFVGSPQGFKINDLGSTNGTFVNDKRIQSHDLIDNDNVTLGRVRFKFKSLV